MLSSLLYIAVIPNVIFYSISGQKASLVYTDYKALAVESRYDRMPAIKNIKTYEELQ